MRTARKFWIVLSTIGAATAIGSAQAHHGAGLEALAAACCSFGFTAWLMRDPRATTIGGFVRYIYDDKRARLHLDECPILPDAEEGDRVNVTVTVNGAHRGGK